MKKLSLLLALAATFAVAQPPAPAPLAPGEIIRVVEVKQANAAAIRTNLGQIFPGITESNGRLIVRGQTSVVDMIEEAIKKLDIPPPDSRPVPNVELTAQLILGSAQENADSKIPSDLEATVRQLRSAFPYKSYRVLDTLVLRARGSGQDLSSNGTLPGGQSYYTLSVNPTVNSGPSPRSVRLNRLRLDLRQEIKGSTGGVGVSSFANGGLYTELDAKEGQKTVIGKANIVNTEDAIFLVITPKVIE
jgi:hypothetical protein